MSRKRPTIAYGITTVPSRIASGVTYETLRSITESGFDKPDMFVDGYPEFGYPTEFLELAGTIHYRPKTLGAWSNWALSLITLYSTYRERDLFVIFQDDLRICKGVREYLTTPSVLGNDYQEKYFNLFTFRGNEGLVKGNKKVSWVISNQLGKGALALMFPRHALIKLFSTMTWITKFHDDTKREENIDGTVQACLVRQGIPELIHNPSLVRHAGPEVPSTLGHNIKHNAKTFPGENWNPLTDEYPGVNGYV